MKALFNSKNGFALIEVLICLCLVNIYLYSNIKLQHFNSTATKKIYLKTLAIIQSKNLASIKKISKVNNASAAILLHDFEKETKDLFHDVDYIYHCNLSKCRFNLK